MNIANTDPPRDSHCLSSFPVDMDKIKAWLDKVNKRPQRKSSDNEIRPNHIFLKLIAAVMKSQPKEFGKVIWGKFVPLDDVDVSMLVDIQGGKDLYYTLVKKCDKLSIQEIANSMKGSVEKVKSEKCEKYGHTQILAKLFSSELVKAITSLLSLITYNLSIPIPFLKLGKNPFGSVVMTNIGSFDVKGLNEVYGPLTFARNIVTFCFCREHQKVVINQESLKPEIKNVVNCCIVYDHRYQDGSAVRTMIKAFEDIVDNTDKYL